MKCDVYVNAKVLHIDKVFTAPILESLSKFTLPVMEISPF